MSLRLGWGVTSARSFGRSICVRLTPGRVVSAWEERCRPLRCARLGHSGGRDTRALRSRHDCFVAEFPAWQERVEVGYVSQAVLQTFGDVPKGQVAIVSPGEPLNVKAAGSEWVLDWHSVCVQGETLVGPPPHEIGPAVTAGAYREAVLAQLREWKTEVRAAQVAYVPAHQGYIVATVCRAL